MRFSPGLGLIALCFCGTVLFCQSVSGQSYSETEFPAILQKVETDMAADPQGVAKRLPETWHVGTYSIPTGPLVEDLKASDLAAARTWLAQVARHLRESQVAASPERQDSRAALREILARPEFNRRPQPTLLQRAANWLREKLIFWIQGLLRFVSDHPNGSRILFWTLIGAAFVLLLAVLLRRWTKESKAQKPPTPLPGEDKLQSWQMWVQDARTATEQGDLRQAIRCVYWAGVMHLLEERPTLIRFTDTPRERVRTISTAQKPVSPSRIEPLSRITTRLERVWYAKMPATSDDLTHSFQDLEALGCRLD